MKSTDFPSIVTPAITALPRRSDQKPPVLKRPPPKAPAKPIPFRW